MNSTAENQPMPTDRDVVDNFDSDQTDAVSITNRISSINNLMTAANKRLVTIEGQIPPGPPVVPQVDALNALITSANAVITRAHAILSRNSP